MGKSKKLFMEERQWRELMEEELTDEEVDALAEYDYRSIEDRDRTLTPEDIRMVRENSALADKAFNALRGLIEDDKPSEETKQWYRDNNIHYQQDVGREDYEADCKAEEEELKRQSEDDYTDDEE